MVPRNGMQGNGDGSTVPGMHSQQQIGELVQAASEPLAGEDTRILELIGATLRRTGTEVQLKHDRD